MVAVLGAVGLLLLLVTWTASIGPDRVVSTGLAHTATAQPSPTTRSLGRNGLDELSQSGGGEAPGWLVWVATALVLLVAVGMLVGVVWMLYWLRPTGSGWRRRRRSPPKVTNGSGAESTDRPILEVMTADAEEQRALLEVNAEPRNAIVACWHRFEVQALRGGLERRPWETTAEYVLGILDLVNADHGAVADLADLYREARYSDHRLTEVQRRRALGALDAIHDSLRTAALR